MKRNPLLGFGLVLALLVMVQASVPTSAQPAYSHPYIPVTGFDFEDGTTQGWQILYNGINGSASLSNSTAQAYHGSRSLALDTTDYNFGGSYALIGVGNTVISPSLTAHLYMISDDEHEPYPGSVAVRFVITDSASHSYSGNQIILPFHQWITLTASRPLTFTAPYTLAVGLNYYNVRPTVRTVWLDYIQWDDQPAATPTPPPYTPSPTPTGTPCNPFGYAPWNVGAPAPQSVAYPASASSSQFVYVAGGYLSGGIDTNQLARYNPAVNQWTTLAAMPDPNSAAAAAYDPSGNKLYVFGGLRFNPQTIYTHTRIYDVAANSWSYGPPMPEARDFLSAGYWNGKIYLVGGSSNQEPPLHNTTWEYDIASGSFITKTSFPLSHIERASAAVMRYDHLYVAGGIDENGVPIAALYDYDILNDTWTARASMPHANYDAGGINLNDKLWLIGGAVNNTETLIYDPAADRWSAGPTLNHPHLGLASASVGAYAVAAGGLDGLGWTNITEVSYNAFTPCTPTPTVTGTPPTSTPTLTATPSPTCSPDVCGPLNPTLTVGNVTSNSIALHATANFDIGTFTFYRSTDGSHFAVVGSAFGHYGDFTDTGLDCATTYFYYVHAAEYGGYQRQGDSNIVTATTASCPSDTPTATATPSNTSTLTYTPTPNCLDQYEPDNDSASAHQINITYDIQNHTFCRSAGQPNDDHDWVKFTLPAGGSYSILTQNLGISADTVITLYDANLNLLRSDDNGGGGRASRIDIDPNLTQLYYLQVVNKSRLGGPGPDYAYQLWLAEIAPPGPTPTDCPNPFMDINGNVFYTAIHYLYCRGVVNGTDPTHYSPAGTSTRGQFAKVVVLGFGLPTYTPNGGQTFTDVPPSYFAYTYIESGYHAAILSGFDQPGCAAHGAQYPCYLPNLPITRGQLTKLVVNAAHYPPYTPANGQTFSDVPPSNVFFAFIETAHYKGVINGYPDGSFRPNNNIRRDEMAQIVYKGVTTP